MSDIHNYGSRNDEDVSPSQAMPSTVKPATATSVGADLIDQKFALRLGIVGITPFVLLTLITWIVHPDWLGFFIDAQLAYGVAILAFMGGVHWGVALVGKDRDMQQIKKDLLWGMLPPVIAWFAMANMFIGFVVQVLAFIFSYKYDKRMYSRFAIPDWFVKLRFQLTCVLIASQIFTFLAANVRS